MNPLSPTSMTRNMLTILCPGAPPILLNRPHQHVHGECEQDHWNDASSDDPFFHPVSVWCSWPSRDTQTETVVEFQNEVPKLVWNVVLAQCLLLACEIWTHRCFWGPTTAQPGPPGSLGRPWSAVWPLLCAPDTPATFEITPFWTNSAGGIRSGA